MNLPTNSTSLKVLIRLSTLLLTVVLSARGQSLTILEYGPDTVEFDIFGLGDVTLIPVGTATDGGETTFQLDQTFTATLSREPIQTEAIHVSGDLVASAAGFELKYTNIISVFVPGAVPEHINGQFGCSSEEGGGGSGGCTMSEHLVDEGLAITTDFTPAITGPVATTHVLAVEGEPTATMTAPSGDSNSGFFANRAAVIGTFSAVGIVVIGAIVFLLLSRHCRKVGKRSLKNGNPSSPMEIVPDSEVGVRPFDLKYYPLDVSSRSIHESSGHSSTSFRPFDLKYEQPTVESAGQDIPSFVRPLQPNSATDSGPQNVEPSPLPLNSRYSSHSTIQTTTTQTVRQMHLQQEADDLRQQMRELQQSMNTGVQGLQLAMTRMMAHIQALEGQVNSDWARGLTDEPPPMYAPADSRTPNTCEYSQPTVDVV
ncbi:hypothetical protein D9758_016817 [Tetrapyrgos nigripes]|uniref:Uncharacterized protein n=1 Tax=Tetrapyrgos nigripes TaxID=182062 RepID=A0A8H5F9N0_9AGAR|nr:hypothetical protein D9758_016817 [Tetrapyrgos nigripes]